MKKNRYRATKRQTWISLLIACCARNCRRQRGPDWCERNDLLRGSVVIRLSGIWCLLTDAVSSDKGSCMACSHVHMSHGMGGRNLVSNQRRSLPATSVATISPTERITDQFTLPTSSWQHDASTTTAARAASEIGRQHLEAELARRQHCRRKAQPAQEPAQGNPVRRRCDRTVSSVSPWAPSRRVRTQSWFHSRAVPPGPAGRLLE